MTVAEAPARILAVLRLAEAEAELADLRPYLADPDAEVRLTAVNALTETAPDGGAPRPEVPAFEWPAETGEHEPVRVGSGSTQPPWASQYGRCTTRSTW